MADTPALPTHPPKIRGPKPAVKIAAAFLLPLFFIIAFPLMFVSATHKPAPHDLSLLIVGPDQVVAQIASGLDETSEFAVTSTDVAGEARASVENRDVDGAIEVTVSAPAATTDAPATGTSPAFTVTTYTADAEGLGVAGVVTAAGAEIASQLSTTSTVVDVAPLAAKDSIGTSLFYLFTFTSLAAYLVIIVLMQVMPKASLRLRFGAVAAASVVAPLIVFGLSSIFVGDYGASFGTVAGLLGVNALYVFTVGAAAILIEQFLGKAATFGIMAFVVFLNFPSAGGATSAALLPPFWQFIHSFYFGAGGYEAFRSIVYFGGNGVGRYLLQLLAWTVGLVLLNVVVHLATTVRRQKKEIAALTGASAPSDTAVPNPKHVKVETYQIDDPAEPEATGDPARRSIAAAAEGANR